MFHVAPHIIEDWINNHTVRLANAHLHQIYYKTYQALETFPVPLDSL